MRVTVCSPLPIDAVTLVLRLSCVQLLPPSRPVTRPVWSTTATVGSALVQTRSPVYAPAGCTFVMASCVVSPSSISVSPVMSKLSTGRSSRLTTLNVIVSVTKAYAALSGFRRTVTSPTEVKVTRPSEETVACLPDSVSKIVPPIVHLTPCPRRTGVHMPYSCTVAPTATVVGTEFLFVICTAVG